MEIGFCKMLNANRLHIVCCCEGYKTEQRHVRKELEGLCILYIDFRYGEMTL